VNLSIDCEWLPADNGLHAQSTEVPEATNMMRQSGLIKWSQWHFLRNCLNSWRWPA